MSGELIANFGQNIYPENRRVNSMPDGQVTPENAQGGGQVKTPEVIKNEEDARKGAEDFIVKRQAERAERARQGKGEVEEKKTASRESGEKADGKNRGEREYFKELPNEQKIIDQVNEFYEDLGDKPLEELPTRLLMRHYLFLRKISEETETSTSFLAILFRELFKRGVDPNQFYAEANKKIEKPTDGGAQENTEENISLQEISKEGITSKELLQEIEILNSLRDPYGKIDFSELVKAQKKVIRLGDTIPAGEKNLWESRVKPIAEAYLRSQKATEDERRYASQFGWYKERILGLQIKLDMQEEIKKITRENLKTSNYIDSLFNRMFDKADADPHEDFNTAMSNAGGKEYTDYMALLNEIRSETTDFAQREKVGMLLKRYAAEHKLREILHNAYYIADTGGEAKQFAEYCKQFASEFADLAFLDSPEVETALRIREQVLYQIKRENNGRIPYEKVAFIAGEEKSEWEKRSAEILREANRKGLLGKGEIADWKIDRALSISRGFGMVTLRFPEIIAECVIHAPPATLESQVSIPWEMLSWELNPLDHKIKRYKIGRDMRGILYAAVTRKKGPFALWNQDELKNAIEVDTIDALASLDPQDEERIVDLRNLFRIGGPFTYSAWRSYTAALKEGDPGLKDLLRRNPGLTSKLLWNTEYEEQAGFKKEYKEKHKNASNQEVLKAWQEEKNKIAAKRKEDNIDGKTLEGAIDRIPHVMLRLITDPTNKLLSKDEIKSLLGEIFEKDIDPNSEEFTRVETDLTLTKENLMKRRREKGEAFSEAEDKLLDEDFEVITDENGVRDEERIRRAKKLQEDLRKKFKKDGENLEEKFVKKFRDRNFAYALTTEDLPWSEFRFAKTGGRGFITRRINDWFQEVQANEATIDLIKQIPMYQSPEQVVAQLKKIFDFSEVHDYDRAREAIEFLAKGIIRMYQMDGILKIPIFGEVMCALNGLNHRGTSFAQTVYGGKAMSWDSDDILMFTEQLRAVLIGEEGYKAIERLRTETGGTLWHSIGKKTKLAFYLLLLFGVYELSKKIVKEK